MKQQSLLYHCNLTAALSNLCTTLERAITAAIDNRLDSQLHCLSTSTCLLPTKVSRIIVA